jgi:hypothetical protein
MDRWIDQAMAHGGLVLGRGVEREVAPPPVRLQYSALPGRETPLPEGLLPTSILQNPTGAVVVRELLQERRSEIERTVAGSLRLVNAVAAALPIDPEDERIVDALMAEKLATLSRRPLRRPNPGQR